MKGQDKTPEKQLNKVEIGNLPENEFRIMIVKMIQDHPGFWKKNGEDAINVYPGLWAGSRPRAGLGLSHQQGEWIPLVLANLGPGHPAWAPSFTPGLAPGSLT